MTENTISLFDIMKEEQSKIKTKKNKNSNCSLILTNYCTREAIPKEEERSRYVAYSIPGFVFFLSFYWWFCFFIEMDPDLLLAMQLQEEFDQEALAIETVNKMLQENNSNEVHETVSEPPVQENESQPPEQQVDYDADYALALKLSMEEEENYNKYKHRHPPNESTKSMNLHQFLAYDV